jgi:uncharacterized protein YqhQ
MQNTQIDEKVSGEIAITTPNPDFAMGGQAVLEGVMMKGPISYAVAVRRAEGNIEMISHRFIPITQRHRWLRLPIIRGAVSLIEMLMVGYRALDFSANVVEQSAKEKEEREKSNAGAEASAPASKYERSISHMTMIGVFAFSMVLAMGLFVALPNLTTAAVLRAFEQVAPEATTVSAEESVSPVDISQSVAPAEAPVANKQKNYFQEQHYPITYNLVSGAIRVLIVVLYIWGISLLKDVRRVFQYHGAEHKVVMAYEKKQPLDIEHIRPMTTLHPRCGTTFIAIVLFVSIFVFAFLAFAIRHDPRFASWNFIGQKAFLIGLHIVFMPLVAGIAYEITRKAGRNTLWLPYRILLWPGFMFQKITTREPDDSMIEVALAAFNEALEPKQLSE